MANFGSRDTSRWHHGFSNGFSQPRRRARREGGLQVVEHRLRSLSRGAGLVPLCHPSRCCVRSAAVVALLRHDLEAVARRAGVERILASGTGGIIPPASRRWA